MDAIQTSAQIERGEQLIKQLNHRAICFLVSETLRLKHEAAFLVDLVREHYAPHLSDDESAAISAYLESWASFFEGEIDRCSTLGIGLDLCECAVDIVNHIECD